MDQKKIKHLSENISSLKSAKFYTPNWAFVGFDSKFKMVGRWPVMRVADNTSCEKPNRLSKELNSAIKPILDKWINEMERELRILIEE